MVKKYVLYMLVLLFVFCFTSTGSAEKETVKTEKGLAGWWKFDEGSGDVLHDSSGNGNDGKIYGATWVKGKTGSTLFFNGKDNYVDCGNGVSLHLDGPLTISTWVKVPSEAKGHMWIISKVCWNVCIEGLVNFFIYTRDANDTKHIETYGTHGIPADNWVHIVQVYDIEYEEIRIYTNGKSFLNQTWSEGAIGGYDKFNLIFGRWAGHSHQHFIGLIGETKIYNRALSAEDIKTNYELELKTKDESLSVIP